MPLEQTIRPNGARGGSGYGGFGGFYDVTVSASDADLKDSSDATFDEAHIYDDGFSGPAGVQEVNFSMDTVTYGGPIAYVKVWIRGKIDVTFFNYHDFQAIFKTYISGAPVDYFGGSFDWISRIFTVNPQTGTAWTAAAINAGTFGWRIDVEGDPAPCDMYTRVSEFYVEIFSPDAARGTMMGVLP